MDLRIAKDEDAELWDDIVDKSDQGTLFHKWDFLKTIEKHTKTKLYPVIGLNGSNPIGIYPLFYKKKGMIKTVFSPPPHCAVTYLGPILHEFNKLKLSKKEIFYLELQKAVDEFVSSELNAEYISIYTNPRMIESRQYRWTGYTLKPIYSYSIDLRDGCDQVWGGLKKNLRQSINSSKRKGVTVELGSREDLVTLHSLMAKRYEDQNRIATVPLEYLLDLYDIYSPENLRIFVAKYDNEVKTGVIDLWYKERITTWIGNPKTDLKNISPNDLLFWETIKLGCESNYTEYEIIGAAGNRRLHKYYSKYNPDLKVNFAALKYTSTKSKLAEQFYLRFMKPAYAKLKIAKKQI